MKRSNLPPLPCMIPPEESRSRNMAAIKSSNTEPELYVRRALHAAGFRFKLHRKDIPGRPDIALPRYRTAVFVNGCFWHGHRCLVDHRPRSNTSYWSAKIERNIERDVRNLEALQKTDWQAVVVWECSLVMETARLLEKLTLLRDTSEHGAKSKPIR